MTSISTVAQMIRDAEKHADDSSQDRLRAIEYYQGEMRDTPADEGRSQMVSRDVRAIIKKVLPSIKRTILGSDIVAEYQPVSEGDEQAADQATDYIASVVAPEVDLDRKIEDAIHDALLLRNGILRWGWKETKKVSFSEHSGLNEDAFAYLVSDPEVEVLENTQRQDVVEIDGQPIPMAVHDCKTRRIYVDRCLEVECVPRERFLIHPDAVTLQSSLLTGDRQSLTRSDLVAMGYDYDTVMGLQKAGDEDIELDERRDFVTDSDEVHRPNEEIDYYNVYVRYDMDEDGIAELRHMCFAGALHERNLLHDEPVDEINYCDVKVMRQPHQWEGISVADDTMDIQRGKTVLWRQTLDNLYWQNNPQTIGQEGVVLNEDAILNPEFGKPIWIRQGVSASDAVGFLNVPFVASESYGMLEYMDREAEDRTGITDASAGLDPNALQNMTATASAMINQAGIGQTELMVQTIAEGLRDLFRGLLRTIIKHQDVARTVRLRGEWVEFDPRHWNAEMDCKINVGLGAGTRERDMLMMQMVMGLQEKFLAAFGADNPFVKPDDLWETTSRFVEAAGLKTPDLYFTQPDPEEVQAKLAQANEAANAPAMVEQAKMQAEMQIKQADMQAKMQLEREKAQTQTQKEAAQLKADMAMEDKRLQADLQKNAQNIEWEREKFLAELEIKRLEVLNPQEGEATLAGGITALIQATQAQVAAANAPRRVIYDEAGNVSGVEVAQ